mgnify:FL=1
MKKLLAILLAAVMLLSSCGVSERNPAEQGGSESPTEQGSSEASGSEAGNGEIVTDVPKSTSDSVDTEAPDSAETAQTTNPFEGIFELDIYGHPLPELRELECALSYEEVCEMYPDKTVLTWLISYVDHTYATRRTQEINDYLVSLGKDYVVYFEPYIDNKYRDPHYVIIQDRIDNGEKFDIIFEFSDFLGQAGLTIPLDDYLQNTEIGQELLELMPENYWRACTNNDGIYGLGNASFVIGHTLLCFYNAELVDKYGYDINKSPLEQLDILHEIDENEEDTCTVYGPTPSNYVAPYTNYRSIEPPLYWDKNTDEAKLALDNQEYLETVYTLSKLYDEGLLIKSLYSLYDDSFFMYCCQGVVPTFLTSFQINDDGTYTVLNAAKEPVTCYMTTPNGPMAINNPWYATGVAAVSEHKDEAFDLLATSYVDATLNNLLTYGVEGVDYTVDEDGSTGTGSFATMLYANPLIGRTSTGNCSEYQDFLRNMLETAPCEDDIEFVPNFLDYYDIMSSASPIMDEFAEALSYGVATREEFDAIVAEYKEKILQTGIQEAINGINAQYAEWKEQQNE